MKLKLRFALLTLIILPTLLMGQDSLKYAPFSKYALQFRVNDFLRFSGFNGSLISLKRHFNTHSALRLGVSFSTQATDYDENYQYFREQDTLYTIQGKESDAYTLYIRLPYVYYVHPKEEIKLFVGTGPTFSYGHTKFDGQKTSQGTRAKETAKHDLYSLGLYSLLGAEWFFHKKMSLSLEYGMNIVYQYSKLSTHNDLNDSYQHRTRTSKSWKFFGNDVLFGLSLYFNGF
jgi:opacity protein-like surface antigen